MKTTKTKWYLAVLVSLLIHFLLLFVSSDKLSIQRKTNYIKDTIDLFVENKQLVIIDDETDESLNKESKFFSKANRKVKNETRASVWGAPKNSKSSINRELFTKEKEAVFSKFIEEKKEGVSSTYDYLPDIKTGSDTILNTAEFLYYSFYKRVEEAIVPIWNSEITDYLKNYEGVRSSLNAVEYITDVQVTLDEDGYFERMNIIKSSGVAGFDNAPGKAFNEASPFENPPKEMLSDDKKIKMIWRFVITMQKSYKFGIKYLNPFDYRTD